MKAAPQPQLSSLSNYKQSGYIRINDVLRGKRVVLTAEEKAAVNAHIEKLRDAFDSPFATLPEDITLWRGGWLKEVEGLADPSGLVGKTITDKAFISASVEEAVAESFASNVILEIKAKRGDNALAIDKMAQGIHSGEGEILFPPSAFKVKSAKRVMNRGKSVVRLVVEVLDLID